MTITTETRTAAGWLRWKGLLATAVLVSIAGNVGHAVLTAPTVYGWGAAIAASISPLFLFWVTHNLVTAPGGAASWRENRIGTAVVAAIALGAFAASFITLRDLMLTFGFPAAIAVIIPLVVDVTIAGASWELVREASASTGMELAEQEPEPEHTAELTYPDSLTWLAPQPRATATEHPEEQVPDTAPTAEQPDPQPAVHRPAEPAVQPVTSDDTDTAPIAVQAEQHPDLEPDPRPAQDTEQVAPTVTDSPEQPAPTPPRFEVHRGGKAPAPRPTSAVTRSAESIAEHRKLAERLVAGGRTAATVEQVTRVLEMTAAGASQRTIAAEVGISSTAVGRIQTAARELAEASA